MFYLWRFLPKRRTILFWRKRSRKLRNGYRDLIIATSSPRQVNDSAIYRDLERQSPGFNPLTCLTQIGEFRRNAILIFRARSRVLKRVPVLFPISSFNLSYLFVKHHASFFGVILSAVAHSFGFVRGFFAMIFFLTFFPLLVFFRPFLSVFAGGPVFFAGSEGRNENETKLTASPS